MIFILEINEFKKYIQQKYDLNNEVIGISIINFPESLPKSEITIENYSICHQCELLYDKYIKQGSSMQINISGPCLYNLKDIFNKITSKYNSDDLISKEIAATLICKMWDEAIHEIRSLLNNSFIRLREDLISDKETHIINELMNVSVRH